jgi:exosortase N
MKAQVGKNITAYLRRHGLWAMAMSACLCAAYVCLDDYLPLGRISFYLPLLTAVLALRQNPVSGLRLQYPLWALVFVAAGIFIPVSTFLYLAFVMLILSLLEWKCGPQPILLAVALLSAAPVISYLIDTFTFPIRLWLSELAASILKVSDANTFASGTSIYFQGREYLVDTGCMGLYMLLVALQFGLLLLVIQTYRTRRSFRKMDVTIYFFLIFLLTVLANLCRILLLIIFNWRSGYLLHDLAGLSCFAVYVLFPAWFMSEWLSRRAFLPSAILGPIKKRSGQLALLLVVVIGLLGQILSLHCSTGRFKSADAVCRRYNLRSPETPSPGIQQFSVEDCLVYVKQVRGFFDTDHQPMMCWKGSGFEFEKVQLRLVGDTMIYWGELIKGEEKLYSAWWYDNGYSITTNAWLWRSRMLLGSEAYSLVNVTASSPSVLENWLQKRINEKYKTK